MAIVEGMKLWVEQRGGGREDGKERSGDSEQKIMFSRCVNYTHVRVNLRNHPCDNCLTGNKCHG